MASYKTANFKAKDRPWLHHLEEVMCVHEGHDDRHGLWQMEVEDFGHHPWSPRLMGVFPGRRDADDCPQACRGFRHGTDEVLDLIRTEFNSGGTFPQQPDEETTP